MIIRVPSHRAKNCFYITKLHCTTRSCIIIFVENIGRSSLFGETGRRNDVTFADAAVSPVVCVNSCVLLLLLCIIEAEDIYVGMYGTLCIFIGFRSHWSGECIPVQTWTTMVAL